MVLSFNTFVNKNALSKIRAFYFMKTKWILLRNTQRSYAFRNWIHFVHPPKLRSTINWILLRNIQRSYAFLNWIHFVHPPKLRFDNTKNEKKHSSELGVFFLILVFISDLDWIQTSNLLSRNQMRYSVAPRGLFVGANIGIFDKLANQK